MTSPPFSPPTDRIPPRTDSFSTTTSSDHRTTTTSLPSSSPDHPLYTAKRAAPSLPGKAGPPPGTYVIQIPKEQIYRIPPPENAKRFDYLSRRKAPRSRCCIYFCWFLSAVAFLFLLAGVTAAVLYLVFQPKSPKYSVQSFSVKGFNLSSSSAMISPEFDVTIRADNPNKRIGIYYLTGSYGDVYYNDVRLGTGSLPAFYQGKKNVTALSTALRGSGIKLTSEAHKALANGERKGAVPLRLYLRAPVKMKVGAVKTWTITVKVNCEVTVNNITVNSKIVSENCDYDVDM
ncbi:hypothetical protein K2173_013975 [Erythroxylum novogranatense]|uniref:Late embryogenesis abundant protein LEA-2 subgroup domain-containing protein n=1 Tax=Erythroxylum novogranatense TaxID=1862640 RepID=A0AAV8SDL2_9ROSI|nr:hypothetical protein K2173_013975 [Erythroxylum novogranatense]